MELSLCKMFEYIKDESNFLKRYINELQNIEQNDFSAIFLDSLEERIIENKQELAAIRVAYEEAKVDLGMNNDLDELDILTDKVTRVNEIIQSLEKIEKILFSYPLEN